MSSSSRRRWWCGELGDVVCWTVGLDETELAEVVHGVGRVAGAAAYSQHEQPPTTLTQLRQAARHRVDLLNRHRTRDRPAPKSGTACWLCSVASNSLVAGELDT